MVKTIVENRQNWWIRKISKFNEKVFIIYKDKKYTYFDLLSAINLMRKFLISNNVKSGQVVAILSDYSFKSIGLFLALMENKNIIVPITSKTESEITQRLEEAFADKKIILDDNNIETINLNDNRKKHELINRLQEDKNAGLILFSSGSTDKPKAMIHDLDRLFKIYKSKKERNSNILVFLMFDHIGGLNTLFNALSSGSTITITESRDVDYVCNLIEKYEVNLFPTSPTFLNLLLISEAYKRHNLETLKMITYGTEPIAESLLNRLKTIFPKVEFLQTFGTSETGIARTFSKSSTSTFLKIDDPNTEFKIVNGELWLKSKTQVLGYLNYKMDNFIEGGWYRTGDLVEEADDGYIKIIGRTKEVINVGGEKVLPTEVESILLQMTQIKDAMVYGQKNAITGQCVAADVVLKDSTNKETIKREIRKFCKGRLDNYKIPIKVKIVTDINVGDRFKKIRRK